MTRMPASVTLGLIAGAMTQTFMIESKTVALDTGCLPTANKHTAKRKRRKAACRWYDGSKPSAKPHNQRNKKGKP